MDVLAFGEILWDLIDGDEHIGGAPFNFAAHVRKCGLSSALISAVGTDTLGERALAEIARLDVDKRFVAQLPNLPTGTVLVSLAEGIPSYEIREPVAWDAIPLPADLPVSRALYFGTLAARSETSAETLRKLLRRFSNAFTFYDVNLRQNFWSPELVRSLTACADVLKWNDDETEMLSLSAKEAFALFPRLKMIITTLGKDGCRVDLRNRSFESPAIDCGPVVDTVGAGDAFSAAFLSVLLAGGTPEEAAIAGNKRGGEIAAQAGAI